MRQKLIGKDIDAYLSRRREETERAHRNLKTILFNAKERVKERRHEINRKILDMSYCEGHEVVIIEDKRSIFQKALEWIEDLFEKRE